MPKQTLDDAQAKYDGDIAKVASLQRTLDLAVLGPRKEEIDQVRGQIEQARGQLAYAQTQLDNTVIRAPITGTILDRNVEKGEFVTTGFVGDKGAKGYIVTMADLNDLQVELDISQSDFPKLGTEQKGVVTTDAYPDRKYHGSIEEVSPEADRAKATVQVKVERTESGWLSSARHERHRRFLQRSAIRRGSARQAGYRHSRQCRSKRQRIPRVERLRSQARR